MRRMKYRIIMDIDDLAKARGIPARSVKKDVDNKKLDLSSIEDIIRWMNTPRVRSNKGNKMPWLDGKRGRRKVIDGKTFMVNNKEEFDEAMVGIANRALGNDVVVTTDSTEIKDQMGSA